jgi:hypothetical protein
MTEGGRAFLLRKTLSSTEGSRAAVICLPPNLLVMKRMHRDKPKQIKKRSLKPNWSIRNIPKGGAKAPAMVEAM